MTIQQAIDWLIRLKAIHGSDTPVFFDCHRCGHSFEVGVIETKAIHLKAHDEKTKD